MTTDHPTPAGGLSAEELLCRCDGSTICPVHNEDADPYSEWDVTELARRIDATLLLARASALRQAADEAEFKFRSMTFRCGQGESSTRLHPVGGWLRAQADALATAPTPDRDGRDQRDGAGG